MKRSLYLAAAAVTFAIAAPPAFASYHGAKAEAKPANATAQATIINKKGEEIGFGKIEQGPNGVLIHVKVSGLTPGKKGLHLHSHGVCDPETGFKSAKGHVGLKEGAHGFMNPDGPEAGDLPNIFVGSDGVGETEIFSNLVTIGSGAGADLLDADGSAFVIHENPDDHITQPIGGAGPRVACGVLKKN